MTSDRWQLIKSTVAHAMEVPQSERTAIVRAACGDDEDLRRDVESLIASAEGDDSLPGARAAIASAAGTIAADHEAAFRDQLENTLGQQYEIIRLLGSGGMGRVYLARERALERFVAIKVLRPDLAVTEVHRERFLREARIAARLSHPGILGLHSFGEIGNLWYFVMTYVRGESLGEKLRRDGRMPWREAHRIFSEVADALECAHRNGVVHCDIKPANILLDNESGRAILADFGISKIADATESLTISGVPMGTPDYMSPEQVSGTEIDTRTDIYSLGAVAYAMLTGSAPFRADNQSEAMQRRVTEDPVPVESIVKSVPADLASIVRTSMARDKADRWPDSESLKEALAGVISSERLPDAVRDLPSFGPYAFLWAAAWLGLALLTERSPAERVLMIFVALIVPVGLMLHLWNSAGRGMRLVDLTRVALWPPEWWGLWWPRALRRPTDIWDRLPGMAKFVRVLLIALVPALLSLIFLHRKIIATAGASYEPWVEAAEWAVIVVGSLAVVGGVFWTRGIGLKFDQSFRLLLGPTLASKGWEDPAIERVLAPPPI